jgi:peptide/nickel transport system permease protein
MSAYIIRRVLAMLLVLLCVLAITFAIFYIFPANPARDICGKGCDAATVASIDQQLGLNKPLIIQFGQYVAGIFFGRQFGQGNHMLACNAPCFGFSYQENLPVTTLLAQRLPVTTSIAIGAAVLWLLGGLATGIVAALTKNTWIDKVVTTISFGGLALPVFLIGIVLLFFLTSKWHLLPDPSYVSIFSDPVGFFEGLIQPWIALAVVYAAVYARFTRAKLIEVMEEQYITTARAKGLRERRVVMRHGLRPALTPVLIIFGMDFGGLLGGAVIVETVYGLPGVGQLLIQAVNKDDIPVVTGIVLLSGFFVIAANLIVDVAHSVLDPRVRYT